MEEKNSIKYFKCNVGVFINSSDEKITGDHDY